MRRILYLWLKHWPIDRLRRLAAISPGRNRSAAAVETAPFATIADAAGQRLVAAVNRAAAAAGLAPGMPLADALSFVPALSTALAEPDKDAAALHRLAEWCGRYSPWTAPDSRDGVTIEITGCAHLWGGEEALAGDLIARLGRQGITARLAIADTLGAACALARHAATGERILIAPPQATRAALAPLPVAALRLDPMTVQGLRRVGLKRIGDLYAMPRAALARRFGEIVARRLDQALGDLAEPLSPLSETPARRVRLSFAEPIAAPADLALAAERLARDLVTRLAREGMGARRLVLACHRVDGCVERIALGTARPTRDPGHLAALFKERLDTVDPGLGVEDMILAAFAVEPLGPEQTGFAGVAASEAAGNVAALIDRLGNRLGLAAITRIETRQSHIPERAAVRVPVNAETDGRDKPGHDDQNLRLGRSGPGTPTVPTTRRFDQDMRINPPRPVRLFDPPEPVVATWLLPDDPPFHFTWRRRSHRVRRADGPERIAPEWWRPGSALAATAIRDYYRVEDEEGRRFWLFRAGLPGGDRPPRWYVHGVFA